MVPHEPLSVLILAGGRSRRLGQDKVWLMLDGEPLVERVARSVLPLANEIIFSTGTPDRFAQLISALPVPAQAVTDQHAGAGPLAGMYAGLAAAANDLVLALAVDLPFLSLPLLAHLVEIAALGTPDPYDAVVPQVPKAAAGELANEPLHALYRRTCLPAIAAHLAARDFVAYGFLPDVRTRYVLPDEIRRFDPDMSSFVNVNTPEDWRRALEMAGQRLRGTDGMASR